MKLKKTMACFFSLLVALGATACTTPSSLTNSSTEEVDHSRTQLYVFNYDGGYGSEWLSKAKASYEELYKDTVFEEGKKGIQIVINNSKTNREGAAILTNVDEVYFTEGIQYYQSINDGAFADITKAVTGTNPYETGKTIESKMETSQQDFYKYSTASGSEVYYAIPHYSGAFGIVYDIDLFDAKGLYIKDGYSTAAKLETRFTYEDSEKSAGPDGEKGTSDDGLPVTYDEFFMLCEYISSRNMTPVAWSGEHYTGYLTMLLNQFIVNDLGAEESLLSYTMDGTANSLGTVNASGNFVKDSNATTITADNAYELYRSESKYYALQALEKLIETDKYHNDNAFTGTHSHLLAQDDFLWSGKDEGHTDPIAMLVDGVWWQSEADSTFEGMATGINEKYSKYNRNFGWMPLPRSSADKAGQTNVYFDHLYSMCFVKKNIASWKLDIAIDFIQYVHTDAAMVEFTKTTNTPKAYNYTLSSDDLSDLTPFGRSLMEYKQNADVVYPLSNEPLFLNNQMTFAATSAYATTLNSLEYANPAQVFHEKSSVTAADYFRGMYTHYKEEWKTL